MKQLEKINSFIGSQKFALIGASRNSKKFGNIVFKTLIKKGFIVVPVNPAIDNIDGHKCYANLSQLVEQIDHIIICTPMKQTDIVIAEAIKLGIRHIWVQQGAQTSESKILIANSNVETYINECILMFARPSGMHKFHRNLVLFFDKLFSKRPNGAL